MPHVQPAATGRTKDQEPWRSWTVKIFYIFTITTRVSVPHIFMYRFMLTHHSYVSSPPKLPSVRWASFCWKPEPSAETWLPPPNPSAERSGPHDPERESLPETSHNTSQPAKTTAVFLFLRLYWYYGITVVCYYLHILSVFDKICEPGNNTWNILCKLHQNLNLTCCHFRQQEEVFLCAVLFL